ncbi:MAG: aminopeptidase, partial [Pirellula sp.]
LQNPNEVLSEAQRERLEQARTAERPVLIVTPEEAKENEKEKSDQLKTWIFRAEAVRDFAFATSRKFIWDAQGHRVNDNFVMAMSYYPNEGNPLWSKYSTHAIIHTLNVYSRYTFDYPYPVAISVNGPVGGMEYPMIWFNGPRPREDGTYSASNKYDLITVIIHEVGHNYFPMIVNSDERQWSWMDEGLNTFLQSLAEQEWEQDYPSQRG